MTLREIEQNLTNLVASFNKEEFIYDLLLAYGQSKSLVSRLKKGTSNLSKELNTVIWKKKLYFKSVSNDADLHAIISEITSEKVKNDERFVIVTDFETLLATDTRTKFNLDIKFEDLPRYADFFIPWLGRERSVLQNEGIADRKAAEKMAKLFDEIKKDNRIITEEEIHSMNIFLTRLLFCYFAEDTGIFTDTQFTNALKDRTQNDGTNVQEFLLKLFEVLNTKEEERDSNLPEAIKAFPYVNGGLFSGLFLIPTFTANSRLALIESGKLDWSAITPDIFGSMFQGVVSEEHRANFGQHYTSVPNIMKLIEPLFLNDLYEDFQKAKGDKNKLERLYSRVREIKIFDPACGSGNFLIIAYKELCRLQMRIIQELETVERQTSLLKYNKIINVKLSNFYGIEIDDFPVEIARLSLYLAEHQIHTEFEEVFGRKIPTLPLADTGNIVKGNACRLDWNGICLKDNSEMYVIGNPPFVGKKKRNDEQKSDMDLIFQGTSNYKNLDYVTSWFKKACDYIQGTNIQAAFVSTNSICQGESVYPLWSCLFSKNITINFARTTFQWKNFAKDNAGVYCVIIGFATFSRNTKCLFSDNTRNEVKNINAYLLDAPNVYVKTRGKTLSRLPKICNGSMPNDGGNLLFTERERKTFLDAEPNFVFTIREFVSTKQYIEGKKRYCLWLENMDIKTLQNSQQISSRIEKVKKHRLETSREATVRLAKTPQLFGEIRHQDTDSIFIPRHSSEGREYIPFGFLDKGKIIGDSASAIYDAEPWIFSFLISKLHMIWVNTVGGKLEGRYRYSNTLVYNTFPFPDISEKQKETLNGYAFDILEEREKYPGKTLAWLYNRDTMPQGLKEAHRQNDLAVERCYRITPFKSDQERLEYLFKQYEKMIEAEKQ